MKKLNILIVMLLMMISLTTLVSATEPTGYFLKYNYENNLTNQGSGGTNCDLVNAGSIANYSEISMSGYSRQYFDGYDIVNDVDSGGTCNFTDGVSFSMGGWYYITNTPTGANTNGLLLIGDIDNTDGFAFFYYEGNSGTPRLKIFNNDDLAITYTTTLPEHIWTHLFFTYNQTDGIVRLYQNGVEIANDTSVTMSLAFGNSNIAGGFSQSAYLHTALLTKDLVDDTYYYERFLDETEVLDLYLFGNVSIPPSPPVIISFTTNNNTIENGSSTTLYWNTTNGDDLDLSGTNVTGYTQAIVTPTTNTTYTLTATNNDGTVNDNITIFVYEPVVIPPLSVSIDSLTATPTTTVIGGNITIAWNTSNADLVTLNLVNVSEDGSVVISPNASITYYLYAENTVSNATGSVIITVTPVIVPNANYTAEDTAPILVDGGVKFLVGFGKVAIVIGFFIIAGLLLSGYAWVEKWQK